MSNKPIAVTMRVEGTPNTRCFQKERSYCNGDRRACSHTIRFAAEPRRVKLPATVLTHANISHAFFSSADDIAAADAATLAPSKRTAGNKKANYIPRCLGSKSTAPSAIQ
uniref:Uncharacterized protein n=1 Tax=Opuntia streptacantha TaxID=393608 RepID=A0A7C9CWK2_OPUST